MWLLLLGHAHYYDYDYDNERAARHGSPRLALPLAAFVA